jgi:hypothetical protein
MQKISVLFFWVFIPFWVKGQKPSEKEGIIYKINEEGTHYIQATFLNQTWVRTNENNRGTLVDGTNQNSTFDIGLRRTRMQIFGQINERAFIYFQFGQNNFNAMYNASSNRKVAAFFHDALCEFKVSGGNQLKLGGGLTIANGLSRFSQPSIGTIMTMDVPVFAQTTVDQTDQFSRKLSIYARGQIKQFDYRIALSDPFPITSNGATTPAIGNNASFSTNSRNKQFQGYFIWQFFDNEGHTTPYMAGTYLGTKKIFNLGTGVIYQKNALWHQSINQTDTLIKHDNLLLLAIESYLDLPLNKAKATAISAYAGLFMTNYGKNYLRYNGLMNPANGTILNANNSIAGQGPTYGNALPMFGTGKVFYGQFGYLLPKNWLKNNGQLMPYASTTIAKYDRMQGLNTCTMNAGVNWLLNGHKTKISFDWQNRPTYKLAGNQVLNDQRKNCFIIQYQIYF